MRIRTLAAAFLAFVAVSVHAALPAFHLDPSEYMKVSDVRAGMKGYGLTVFRGVKIERFGVTVVDVMPGQNVGEPLILIKMSGGPITLRKANIIHGMSGSPVYINGKLLGAVAMGYPFPNEPVAFVTPIQDMIDAFDPNLPSKPVIASAPSAVGANWAAAATQALGTNSLQPFPVFSTNLRPHALSILNNYLAPYGLRAAGGMGGGYMAKNNYPKGVRLEPGSGIGVSLMQGDVDVSYLGTVTYRKGNRILAFGHPLFGLGPINMPATTIWVHDVFSGINESNKFATPIETVGTITEDRPFSIGGVVKQIPKMIPLTVHVNDRGTGKEQDFHMGMTDHPILLPGLVVSGAAEVIDRLRGFPGDAMATATFTITPEGMAPITRTNRYFDSNPSAENNAALSDVTETLLLLTRNPFGPIPIKSVDVSVDVDNGHETAVVDRAWIEKDKVQPGDTVTVQAVLKPYERGTETHTFKLKIPDNAPNGAAQVVVFGGATGIGRPPSSPGGATSGVTISPSAVNVQQIIDKFLEREKNDDVAVRILLPGSAVNVDGQRLSDLPDPLADVMKSAKASNTRLERDDVRATEHTSYVVSGSQMLTLNIERKSVVDKTPAAVTIPAVVASSDDSTDSTDDSSTTATADSGGITGAAAPRMISVDTSPDTTPDWMSAPATVKTDAKTDSSSSADAKSTDDKSDDTKTDKDKDDGKSPGRVAAVWKQSLKTQFDPGKFDNTTVTSTGEVQLTAKLTALTRTTRPYVWSLMALPDGGALAGTGNSGEILKIDAKGNTSVFCDTDALEVQALARDTQGNVYAGTSPNGRILKVTPDGKSSTFFDTKQKYVFSLAVDSGGTLYAGTGPEGRVFAVNVAGEGRELVKLPQTSVLSLTARAPGGVLAGTAPDGLVYDINPLGKAQVVYDAPESNVTAVASDNAGDMFVATAPTGKVYEVYPDGRADVLLDKSDGSLMALQATGDGTVYAAGGKKVYRITKDKTVSTLDNDDQNQIVSLAFASDGGLLAGSANMGAVYHTAPGKSGNFVSSVHDAGLRAAWGRLQWSADVPDGATLRIQTRSGDTAQPDDSWSSWTSGATGNSGPVNSPPARFLQYKVTLAAAPGGASPALKAVTVRYLTDNRPPTVKFTAPRDTDRWGGKKTVKWLGTDPDSDTLTYSLLASTDNGATWKPIADITAKTAAKTDGAGDAKTVDVKDDKKAADKPVNTTKSSYSWDTSALPDGAYTLKVVASDKSSNPSNAMTAEDIAGPVLVVNTKPTVAVHKESTSVAADKTVSVTGVASAASNVVVVNVSYRVDKGDWTAAIPTDGIFDSPSEEWKVSTDALTTGSHTIEVRATDEVDNNGSATVTVTVP